VIANASEPSTVSSQSRWSGRWPDNRSNSVAEHPELSHGWLIGVCEDESAERAEHCVLGRLPIVERERQFLIGSLVAVDAMGRVQEEMSRN